MLADDTTNTNTNTNTNFSTKDQNDNNTLKGPQNTASDVVSFSEPNASVESGAGRTVSILAHESTSGTHHDSVSDYLARPRKMTTLDMSTNELLPITLYLSDPQVLEKLRGSFGIGGRFHVKIVWNSDPMLRGAGILAYLPPGLALNHYPKFNGIDAAIFLSGCPHVYIDLARDTSVELSIPYIGEIPYIPANVESLQQAVPLGRQVGSFAFYPISSPTGPAGAVPVTAQAYMFMTELKTFGQFAAVPSFHFQMESAASVLEAVKKSKVVSSTVGRISSWLNGSEGNDFWGKFGRTSGVLLGGVEKIADLLGWSKPIDVKSLQSVVANPMSDVFTSDCTFNGIKFAQNIDAGISAINLSDDGKDQMLIRNFMRDHEMVAIHPIAWSKDDLPEDRLINLNVSPQYLGARHVGSDNDITVYFNHLGLLSSIFQYWRGELKLTINPIMTKFHSGRLRLVYTPLDIDDATVLNNMSYTYTHIFDLSDPSSYDFIIPFVSLTPWQETNHHLGQIKLFVETPLHCSAGVSSDIQLYFTISPTDSLEFAVPIQCSYDADYLIPEFAPHTSGFELQSENFSTIKFVDGKSDSAGAHQLCVGDPVRSLRTLLRRFWTAHHVPANSEITVYANPIPFDSTDYVPDMITVLQSCFAFSRGGLRYVAQAYGIKTLKYSADWQVLGAKNGVAPNTHTQQTSYPAVQLSLDDPVKIEFPYYCIKPAINHFTPRDGDHTANRSRGAADISFFGGAGYIPLMRAGADDFELGFLIGPIPFKKLPEIPLPTTTTDTKTKTLLI